MQALGYFFKQQRYYLLWHNSDANYLIGQIKMCVCVVLWSDILLGSTQLSDFSGWTFGQMNINHL